MLPSWMTDVAYIAVALLLVVLNGFFVAAEFALVKVRPSQMDALVLAGKPFAKTAKWLAERLDAFAIRLPTWHYDGFARAGVGR